MESNLPAKVYVRLTDEEGVFEAFGSYGEAIDGDGPTTIGEYQLVEQKRFEKVVEECQEVDVQKETQKLREAETSAHDG